MEYFYGIKHNFKNGIRKRNANLNDTLQVPFIASAPSNIATFDFGFFFLSYIIYKQSVYIVLLAAIEIEIADILVYPKPKPTKRKRKADNLPSVLTSQKRLQNTIVKENERGL